MMIPVPNLKREYDDTCAQFGFMCVSDSNAPDAQTLRSSWIIVPDKLQRHLHTNHLDCKDKLIVFAKRKYDELKHSITYLTSVIKGYNENVREASHKFSHHIADCGAAISCAEDIVPRVLGDNHSKVIKKFISNFYSFEKNRRHNLKNRM
jgi:hypothetical protein